MCIYKPSELYVNVFLKVLTNQVNDLHVNDDDIELQDEDLSNYDAGRLENAMFLRLVTYTIW